MTRYFTFHWQQRSWRPDVNKEGRWLGSSGSNVFLQRGVSRGDIVYIVSLIDGYLYLGSRLTVSKIVTRPQAVRIIGSRKLYNAKDWIIGEDGATTPLNLKRRLAAEVTRKLKHKNGKGFYFKRGAQRLDGQATRGLQEIDAPSAKLLDHIIEITDRHPQKKAAVTVSSRLVRDAIVRASDLDVQPPDQATDGLEDPVLEAPEKSMAKGQGFFLDSKLRKLLEDYAMDAAKQHFESMGYVVEDHSKNHPYDLCCRGSTEFLYVEVKGTQTDGEGIILTAGEVKFARSHKGKIALFVLHSIKVSEDQTVLTNGKRHLIEPWYVAQEHLTPVSYKYELPRNVSSG
jgi:hypothetical protein